MVALRCGLLSCAQAAIRGSLRFLDYHLFIAAGDSPTPLVPVTTNVVVGRAHRCIQPASDLVISNVAGIKETRRRNGAGDRRPTYLAPLTLRACEELNEAAGTRTHPSRVSS
ncbi:hypothetical protein B1T45_25910 [Mycobacterium kansasii]|uniref:Uncharacterized protein n=4 Tax=Mycobacterium kansasii TaxID=1768 RepID=A0A1V3WYI2_MYCKA|nr:hypothetical protein MKAN_03600 [Mycobacterium kansasii ATCC 12478]ARG58584.1 hypothetical protein B1T43_25370 [Mycobacterium kansasii]EUA18795.1 hypothetical protein I545_2740 [Mycobacterium kansasii 662]ARG64098.1 hypothetical protein B1T45_25910 [Mycobacterium kansasii]ARG71749.1 hypothetical protein B1T47_25260 [Mycobacterium kansasii]